MKKLLFIALTILLSVNAYAMDIPSPADVKVAADDSNIGRDFVDVHVRYYPDDRQHACGLETEHMAGQIASAGAVVIWATQPSAVIGRDVTMTTATGTSMVAGIVVEDIASGNFGAIRVYGYYDDALVADSTHAIAQGDHLTTASIIDGGIPVPGLLGSGETAVHAASGNSVAIALEDGEGTDKEEMQVFIRCM